MRNKIILAILLALAAVYTHQAFFPKSYMPRAIAASQPAGQIKGDPLSRSGADPAAAIPETSFRDITIDMPKYTAVFSTRGGALKSLKLKGYYRDCHECTNDIWLKLKRFITGKKEYPKPRNAELVELVDVRNGMPYPLAVTFSEPTSDIAADAAFEASVPQPFQNPNDKRTLIFTNTSGSMRVEKIFTFDPAHYRIALDVKVRNLSPVPITQTAKLNWYQYADSQNKKNGDEYASPAALIEGHVVRKAVRDLAGETVLGPNASWGAYESKYFMVAFIPGNPLLTNVILTRDSANMVTMSMKGQKDEIPAGQDSVSSYTIYMGPKKYSILNPMSAHLEGAVDFGWFRWLSIPLLYALNLLQGVVVNYGIAIILLTIIIKLMFLPLGSMSSESMKVMRDLKPRIDKLKEKYKDDKARAGSEIMVLYRQYKVNPVSGILPILIQVPVFIGLYRTLMYAVELRHAPFFFWIQDLSARDPYYITPILMGITQFIVQKITPSVGNQEMKKVMLWMPVVFTFIFMSLPAGLVIYWMLNNILQIWQQFYVNRKLGLNDVIPVHYQMKQVID